jgi:hypothetical protein
MNPSLQILTQQPAAPVYHPIRDLTEQNNGQSSHPPPIRWWRSSSAQKISIDSCKPARRHGDKNKANHFDIPLPLWSLMGLGIPPGASVISDVPVLIDAWRRSCPLRRTFSTDVPLIHSSSTFTRKLSIYMGRGSERVLFRPRFFFSGGAGMAFGTRAWKWMVWNMKLCLPRGVHNFGRVQYEEGFVLRFRGIRIWNVLWIKPRAG